MMIRGNPYSLHDDIHLPCLRGDLQSGEEGKKSSHLIQRSVVGWSID